MAHFAQLDEKSNVIDIVVINNDVINNEPFPASEPIGVSFCKSLYGENTIWKQTSYNASFRYNYAGIGYSFDPTPSPDGAFIPLKPYSDWVLDTQTYRWIPPVPYPQDGKKYYWDQETHSWVLMPS